MKIRDTLTVGQQRQQFDHKKMVAIGLEANLRQLGRAVLSGDLSKAQEFQQKLRYAPAEMVAMISDALENKTL